jgi:hypothetical protein
MHYGLRKISRCAASIRPLQYWQISAPKQLGFVMKQAGTQLENKKEVRWQDHKSSCGKKKG